MKKINLFFSIFLILFLNGCLTYHVVEYIIEYDDDFNSGHITANYSDIRSAETDPEKQQNDFNE